MKDALSTTRRYDGTTIWLHWLSAALVIALWCAGQSIDWFPRGTPRVFARSLHISAGALLGLLLCYRLWWRLTAGERLPAVGTRGLQVLAKAVQGLLYLTLLAAVVLGLANVWVRGDNLFNLIHVPAFDPGNKPLRASVEELHELAANLLLLLAAFHGAAGLLHHYLFKDEVLGRMLPALRRR